MSLTIRRAYCWFTGLFTLAMPVHVAGFTPSDDCTVLPRPEMRVRLTLKAEALPLAADKITQVVTQVWSGEGLMVRWVPATDPPSWDGLDLWIHARRTPVVKAEHALSSVMFVNGAPQKFIQVSIDNTVDLVRRNLSQRLSIQPTARALSWRDFLDEPP